MTGPTQPARELPEHRVAVVVFTSVRAVDFSDASYIAETAIRQALKTSSIEDPKHLTVTAKFPGRDERVKVHVRCLREVGMAAGNGYLGTGTTSKAYRESE